MTGIGETLRRAGLLACASIVGLGLSAPMAGGFSAAQADEFVGKQAGDFMIRGRALVVLPNEDSEVTLNGVSLGDDTVEITVQQVPEVDFSYFITDHIALELIAALSEHQIALADSAVGDVDLGSVFLLPPTLTAQYHIFPNRRFSPYVGVGVNGTFFLGEDTTEGGPVTDLGIETVSVGFAVQAGIDYFITDNFFLNADLKRLFLNADAEISTVLDPNPVEADIDIDPWIFGVGVGFKF